MQILLVEDDRKAAQILANGLEEEGFVVDVAGSGEEGDDLDNLTNLVDVHVSHLRRKIESGRPTVLIQTVRGRGFRLAPPDESGPAANARTRARRT